MRTPGVRRTTASASLRSRSLRTLPRRITTCPSTLTRMFWREGKRVERSIICCKSERTSAAAGRAGMSKTGTVM